MTEKEACMAMWRSLTEQKRWDNPRFIHGAAILCITAYTDVTKGDLPAGDETRRLLVENVNHAVRNGFIDC